MLRPMCRIEWWVITRESSLGRFAGILFILLCLDKLLKDCVNHLFFSTFHVVTEQHQEVRRLASGYLRDYINSIIVRVRFACGGFFASTSSWLSVLTTIAIIDRTNICALYISIFARIWILCTGLWFLRHSSHFHLEGPPRCVFLHFSMTIERRGYELTWTCSAPDIR